MLEMLVPLAQFGDEIMNIIEKIGLYFCKVVYENKFIKMRKTNTGLFVERIGDVSDHYIEYCISEYFKQLDINPSYMTIVNSPNKWQVIKMYDV